MLHFSVGFVLFHDRYLRECYVKESCLYPGMQKELIDLLNHQLNQISMHLDMRRFPHYTASNASSAPGLLDLLENGSLPLTVPWFTVSEERFKDFDFILPPLMGGNHYVFYIHSHSLKSGIKFYRVLPLKMYAVVVVLDILAGIVIMYQRRNRTPPGSTESCWLCPSIANMLTIASDLSFQQRSRRLWVSWQERMIITLWSLCMTMVVMRSIKAGYTSSMTVVKYSIANNWNDLAQLMQAEDFIYLLQKGETSLYHEIVMKDQDTAVLRNQFTSRNVLIVPTGQLEAHLENTPGTVALLSDDSGMLDNRVNAINMIPVNSMMTMFSSMMVSRANFTNRKLLINALALGASNIVEFGYLVRIRRKYIGQMPRLQLSNVEAIPITMKQITIAAMTIVWGICISVTVLSFEIIVQKSVHPENN